MMILSITTLVTAGISGFCFKQETKATSQRVKNINMAIGFILLPALITLLSYHAFMWMYRDLTGQYGEAIADWFFVLAGPLLVFFWGIFAVIAFASTAEIANNCRKFRKVRVANEAVQ